MFNKIDDGSLRGFLISEIPNTNIVVRSYRLYEIDVDKIKAAGVTTVLSL
jgi:hypothetical protein